MEGEGDGFVVAKGNRVDSNLMVSRYHSAMLPVSYNFTTGRTLGGITAVRWCCCFHRYLALLARVGSLHFLLVSLPIRICSLYQILFRVGDGYRPEERATNRLGSRNKFVDGRVHELVEKLPIYIYIYGWFFYQLVDSPVDKFILRADLAGCSLLRSSTHILPLPTDRALSQHACPTENTTYIHTWRLHLSICAEETLKVEATHCLQIYTYVYA